MPSNRTFKALNAAHRAVVKVSRGRLGWKADGMPVVQLTTTGRKSGQPRTVMLTSPYQDGDTITIVASRGGNEHDPAWFLNLRENPEVTAVVEGVSRSMHARIATAEEKAEVWPKFSTADKYYAKYQTRINRDIPVVFLEPSEHD